MHRRAFLKASAAAAGTPLLGTGRSRGATKSQGSANGRLVVIYDDAPVEDYEKAFPVHRDLDLPACVAPVSTWIRGKDDYCSVEQLQEMKNDAGFEVMAQGREHESLTASQLVHDVAPGDAKVYPKFHSHAYHSDYAIEVTDGDRSVTRKVIRSGRDGDGLYIKLDGEVGEAFDASDPDVVERYPPETMKYVLSNSQAQLRHMGFRADNLVAPYDRFSSYTEQFASQYYDAVGNAVAGTDGLNDPADLDPFGLRRWYFIENGRRRDRFHRLDAIARENKLAIFGAHTYKEAVTAEKIQELLQGATERGIEVVTLREALAAYGVTGATTTTTAETTTTAKTTTAETTTTETTTTTAGATNATTSDGDGSDGDGMVPDVGNEGIGAMAVLAGAGASLGGWHFLRRD